MIHAYDSLYLEKARIVFARFLDFSINDLGYKPETIYSLFLQSPYCRRFEIGDPNVLAGISGIELAYEITGRREVKPRFTWQRSKEYWAGWALAYFQWMTSLPFKEINEIIPIETIISMYTKYHEMDIQQFVDELIRNYKKKERISNLKKKRTEANLSQSELAKSSGVPLRSIQQYEQKVKNINAAKIETGLALATALHCPLSEIIEPIF